MQVGDENEIIEILSRKHNCIHTVTSFLMHQITCQPHLLAALFNKIRFLAFYLVQIRGIKMENDWWNNMIEQKLQKEHGSFWLKWKEIVTTWNRFFLVVSSFEIILIGNKINDRLYFLQTSKPASLCANQKFDHFMRKQIILRLRLWFSSSKLTYFWNIWLVCIFYLQHTSKSLDKFSYF